MEEISLREIIETILKGKWIIAIVTAAFMLASGIVSFFFIAPVYEAQTMLMISPITESTSENKDQNSFFGLVGSLSQYPQMTVDTYKEQIKAPVILNYIREKMGLSDSSLAAIGEKINVNAIKNTNLLTISIRDTDPSTASKFANLVSERFTQFVTETNKKQAENSANFIKKQQEEEQKNLDKALTELKDFVSKPRGPEELKQELESKLKQLTDYKTLVTQLTIDESSKRASLQNGQELIKRTSRTIILNKSILDDELLSEAVKEKTGKSLEDISNIKMSSEEVNDVYTEISKSVAALEIELSKIEIQRKITEAMVSKLQNEIEIIQAELAEKQQQYDILNHNVELIKQTYDAYQQKYKESMIKQSADLGKSSIIIVSEAVPPKYPVAPNKMLNVLIAAVLGLMLSTFLVFLKEYWKNSLVSNIKA